MPRKKAKSIVPADPQKSSAAQFPTDIASTGSGSLFWHNAPRFPL